MAEQIKNSLDSIRENRAVVIISHSNSPNPDKLAQTLEVGSAHNEVA